MGQIYFDTNCNAPGCIGRIVDQETGRDILIQTDWDYPGIARTFGWTPADVQRRSDEDDCDIAPLCHHRSTDGTIDCPECGVTPGEFIASAADYLCEHDGATADDPGYFDE